MFIGEFRSEKKEPNKYFGAQIGDPLSTTSYASFLQNLFISVNVEFSASFSGPSRADFILGCQLLRLATLGLFCVLSTSTTWISGFLVAGGGGFSVEFVSSSNGISLWRIVDIFYFKLPCIVMNSHKILTSPNANWRD